ncbi:XRE family transcriptional regulator [Pseudomonas sp. BN102]|uniref:helix-turn-helix domain-containing protein n=1 Tax=Pseudomonas sp. BN102 TaxID=2567886 RepID=UPI0024581544|nr:XRE family transcriptional regulator [Pseudomonas sp. BN102]MDH4609048.1 transcriptional regulator [Pseudomonas sp. BN102]
MSAVAIDHAPTAGIHELAERLKEFQRSLERAGGTIIQTITSEAEYDRALALLDELTENTEETPEIERLVDQLCRAIKRYEDSAPQFAELNAGVEAITGVQMLKFLMAQNHLTGSDLPEIGDKSVVSRTLNGKRTLSSADIQALSRRFHVDPSLFFPVA